MNDINLNIWQKFASFWKTRNTDAGTYIAEPTKEKTEDIREVVRNTETEDPGLAELLDLI